MPIGTVSPTPSAILIEKTKYDVVIKCDKDGYQEATYFNKSGAAGATLGNIVLGGFVGWGIDSATGSDDKYDSPVNLSMVPEERTVGSAHSRHHAKHVASKAKTPPPTDEAASSTEPTDKPPASSDAVSQAGTASANGDER